MVFLDLSKLSAPQVYKDDNGIEIHTVNGVLHREDGPAVISPTHQEWYLNGVLHRTDGPARMFHCAPSGHEKLCEWWFEGKYQANGCVDHDTFHQHLHKCEKK